MTEDGADTGLFAAVLQVDADELKHETQ